MKWLLATLRFFPIEIEQLARDPCFGKFERQKNQIRLPRCFHVALDRRARRRRNQSSSRIIQMKSCQPEFNSPPINLSLFPIGGEVRREEAICVNAHLCR